MSFFSPSGLLDYEKYCIEIAPLYQWNDELNTNKSFVLNLLSYKQAMNLNVSSVPYVGPATQVTCYILCLAKTSQGWMERVWPDLLRELTVSRVG